MRPRPGSPAACGGRRCRGCCERRVEEDGVDEDERRFRRHVERDRPRLERRAAPRPTAASTRTAEVMDLEIGRQRAGADPAQVEDRADQPVQPLDLGVDRARRRRGPARAIHSDAGSARFPAVARMLASGVRRSWDTESSRALLNASLRRATSARTASSRSRSRRRASAIWSAARAIKPGACRVGTGRVPLRPISRPAATRRTRAARLDPASGRPLPAVGGARSRPCRRGSVAPGARVVGPDPVRRLVTRRPDERRDDGRGRQRSRSRVGDRSARCRAPRASPRRGRAARHGSAARRSAGRIDCGRSAVAIRRLMANDAVASVARRSASVARSRPSAARRPTASATIRTRTRLRSSTGSATTSEKRGSVNRMS